MKRTTETVLEAAVRDADAEVAKAEAKVESARDKLRDAIARRDAATDAATRAAEAALRARNALAAYTGLSLDELVDQAKARQATTGTHDPDLPTIEETDEPAKTEPVSPKRKS